MHYLLIGFIFSYHLLNAVQPDKEELLNISQFQQKFPSLSEKARAYGLWDKYPAMGIGTSEFIITLISIQQTQIHDLEHKFEILKNQNNELKNDLTHLKTTQSTAKSFTLSIIKQLTPSLDTFLLGSLLGIAFYSLYKL